MEFKEELDKQLSLIKGKLIEQRIESLVSKLDMNNLNALKRTQLLSILNMRFEQLGKAIS